MMHLGDKLATMHNTTFVSKVNFVKLYNNFVQPRPQGLPRGGARAEEDPGKIR
jgi:hypothetical protein